MFSHVNNTKRSKEKKIIQVKKDLASSRVNKEKNIISSVFFFRKNETIVFKLNISIELRHLRTDKLFFPKIWKVKPNLI